VIETAQDSATILLPLGAVLLASLGLEALGRRTRLPRVTLLILFGFLAGPAVLGWIPDQSARWYPLVADTALGMIGFLLGGKLTRRRMRSMGKLVFWVSLVQVMVTFLAVAAGLWLLGLNLPAALVLAAIATATDPAATTDVISETGARGEFTRLLQSVVAIDDAWGLLAFSFALVAAMSLLGDSPGMQLFQHGMWELLGAITLGLLLGFPVALVTGRLRDHRPVLVEALGAVLLCVGLARWLEVSYLLSCVTLGATVANVAKHHKRPFHAVEGIEWPFVILFFVLSGAQLSGAQLLSIGWVGLAYIVLRCGARFAGGLLAGTPAWAREPAVRWSGAAMLPQAGVAMAMAMVAAQASPVFAFVPPLVVASTIFFELLGPLCTRFTLQRVGDTDARGA
tara:strand:- start:2585 stop:3775 length:1191 start_codon:yes stop_codon:yes gene_type:complete